MWDTRTFTTKVVINSLSNELSYRYKHYVQQRRVQKCHLRTGIIIRHSVIDENIDDTEINNHLKN